MLHSGNLTITTPGDREILITRVFNAPRNLVFDAMSKADLLKRWLSGPPGWSMTECDSDVRVGGTFRHVWRGPGGAEMAMSGVYREVSRPDRIVRTESFSHGCEAQAGEQVGTLVLAEYAGKTTLTLTVLYPSREARDAAIASGMEHGLAASYDALDTLLTSVA
jgi:uncharacterized protein YndB with AHSA1/START domain